MLIVNPPHQTQWVSFQTTQMENTIKRKGVVGGGGGGGEGQGAEDIYKVK